MYRPIHCCLAHIGRQGACMPRLTITFKKSKPVAMKLANEDLGLTQSLRYTNNTTRMHRRTACLVVFDGPVMLSPIVRRITLLPKLTTTRICASDNAIALMNIGLWLTKGLGLIHNRHNRIIVTYRPTRSSRTPVDNYTYMGHS